MCLTACVTLSSVVQVIKEERCNGQSNPFVLGGPCTIGFAFWLAVAGALCTWVASSLAIWAYQSTKTHRYTAQLGRKIHLVDQCRCVEMSKILVCLSFSELNRSFFSYGEVRPIPDPTLPFVLNMRILLFRCEARQDEGEKCICLP